MGVQSKMFLNDDAVPKGIPEYPQQMASLPDGRLVSLEMMSNDQLSQTFLMIQDAARTGNGFAVDEYTSESEFRDEIKGGYCFAVVDVITGDLIAAFILAISKFYRGASVADPYIIVRPTERSKGIGEFCLRMCVKFAEELGFLGMYVDTFCNNYAMIRIIENVGGFDQVGILPMGGRLKNGDIIGSVIFYRDLRPISTSDAN